MGTRLRRATRVILNPPLSPCWIPWLERAARALAKDLYGYRRRLRPAVLRTQVCLLTYIITSNHIHLVVWTEAPGQIAVLSPLNELNLLLLNLLSWSDDAFIRAFIPKLSR